MIIRSFGISDLFVIRGYVMEVSNLYLKIVATVRI